MQWKSLTSLAQVDDIIAQPHPIAIFKHSTRCSISSMAKSRLERSVLPEIPFYYLDLLAYRQVSDYIAEKLGILHQSPQLIVIKEGNVLYHDSHNSIEIDKVNDALKG
jgi:bacillithiol system protein YtxJ